MNVLALGLLPRFPRISLLAVALIFYVSGSSIPSLPATAQGVSQSWRIIAEPDVLVTHDFDAPHVETLVSVNPTNPKNILGGSTTFAHTNGGLFNKTYASLDGGYSWTDVATPDNAKYGSGDQQVAFGRTGTAYYVSLVNSRGMDFYRSTDGGLSWSAPLRLQSWDHEQIAVDLTRGPYSGRVYLSGEGEAPKQNPHNPFGDRELHLLWSGNDGHTFSKPVVIATGKLGKGSLFDQGGVAANGLAVLTDGTVVAGIVRYQNNIFDKKTDFQRFSVTTSADGGKTFRQPTKVVDYFVGTPPQREARWKRVLMGDLNATFSGPELAGDSSNSPFANRIYAVWMNFRNGHSRVYFSYSADHGHVWSTPQPVAPDEPLTAAQFQPAIAVNNQGMVGVIWFDTRDVSRPTRFNAYFTASLDGGASFLAPQRLSSEPSTPRSPGNLRPVAAFGSNDRKSVRANFISAYSRWPDGGDYIGLAADANSAFHAFWPDSRSGTYQIYTSRISVTRSDVALGEGTAPAQAAAKLINDKVSLVIEPVQYLPDAREFLLPIRLKNVSHSLLYGPLVARLKSSLDQERLKFGGRPIKFEVLNAPNGKSGVGAAFDYTAALGPSRSVAPGALSEPIVWRVRLENPADLDTLQLSLDVTGFY